MDTLRGGSNEYPQSMFSSKNKTNNVYPCKPQFYYIKVGFKGVKIIASSARERSELYGREYDQGKVLFVCVEVLRPSQPNGVMSSAVSLPNHTSELMQVW